MEYSVPKTWTVRLLMVAGLVLLPQSALPDTLSNTLRHALVLGPGDTVQVSALHASELGDKPFRVDESGYISLPLAGRVKALGLTTDQLSLAIRDQLNDVIRNPEVSVNIVELRSHPVSILGALKAPGVYQLQGEKRLLEVLSLAGGLDQDAGYSIRISRRKAFGGVPLPEGQVTTAGEYTVGDIALRDLMEARHPELNVVILPDDVVTVPRAKLVYVIGEVRKAGGFVLRERESMTVLQALSMAEGLTAVAGSKKARILRPSPETNQKIEIPVNVHDILAGRAADTVLLPEDVLFIPNSAAKNATLRGIEIAIQMGTGLVIWRR